MTAIADPLWTFDDLVAATGAVVDGAPSGGIGGVSIDTRTIQPGDLFVALTDVRDGHEFVTAAFGNGAAAALVASGYAMKPGDGVLLRVADPLVALEALGRAARVRLAPDARVIAVTGSAGKTTTKEMLRACCARLGATHASEKSYNNLWGVPLTLARMPAATRYAIFEIGMNHAGEITPLTRMVRPHVAIVTNVEPVHLAQFASVDEIAEAKAEIFLGLEPGGAAVVNFDSPHYALLRVRAEAREASVYSFSSVCPEDDQWDEIEPGRIFLIEAREVDGVTLVHASSCQFVVGAIGRHLVLDSLAVVAALSACGIRFRYPALDGARAVAALGSFQAQPGRGERLKLRLAGSGEILLIDESYNANPASMRAALDAMRGLDRTAHRRRIVVFGEMLELGAEAERLHLGLKDAIDAAGIDLVFAVGPNMKKLFDLLPEGMQGGWAETALALEAALVAALRPGDVVMIKGSNGSRTWQLAAALKAAEAKSASRQAPA